MCSSTHLKTGMCLHKGVRLPEVATASKLNLRWTEARATLGSRVVSSSPLRFSMSRVSKLSSRSQYHKVENPKPLRTVISDHPLVQMPKLDPRDNSLPCGDGKPVCRLEKNTSALKLSSCCNSTQSCFILTRQQPDINPVLTVFTNSL